MITPGPRALAPRPRFYYQPGGGPLLDMGPYYLTSLIHLLGPVARVVGASARPRATSGPSAAARGRARVPVDIDTHVTGSSSTRAAR